MRRAVEKARGAMKRIAWKILATLLATIACALPAAAQYDETAKSFHLLPHLADGGGWQSVLLVTNVSQSASRCTFNVYGVPLNRFHDLSGITAAGSTATFQLEGPGGYLVWYTKNELAAASGYATLDCAAPVVAQIVFALYDGVGVTALGVTAAATVFSAQAATVFQFLVLQPAATLGFAIANDTNAEASCRIVLEDTQRTNLGEATLSVPAKSNRAQMLNDAIAIPGTFLGGTATVSCNQPVAMIGLHFELWDRTIITFSTLPPAILSTAWGELTDGAVGSFGAGTWIVGEDIVPGRYFTNPSSGCYWERLSDIGESLSDILANEFITFDSGQEIVDIASSDYAFQSDPECGTWSQTPVAAPSSGIPPGRWLVGRQIPTGEYETNASGGCYWERLSGFSGNLNDTIENDFVGDAGRQIVRISSSDEGFYSDSDCGTWSRRTGSTLATPAAAGSRVSGGGAISPATDPRTIDLNRRMYRAKSGLR